MTSSHITFDDLVFGDSNTKLAQALKLRGLELVNPVYTDDTSLPGRTITLITVAANNNFRSAPMNWVVSLNPLLSGKIPPSTNSLSASNAYLTARDMVVNLSGVTEDYVIRVLCPFMLTTDKANPAERESFSKTFLFYIQDIVPIFTRIRQVVESYRQRPNEDIATFVTPEFTKDVAQYQKELLNLNTIMSTSTKEFLARINGVDASATDPYLEESTDPYLLTVLDELPPSALVLDEDYVGIRLPGVATIVSNSLVTGQSHNTRFTQGSLENSVVIYNQLGARTEVEYTPFTKNFPKKQIEYRAAVKSILDTANRLIESA